MLAEMISGGILLVKLTILAVCLADTAKDEAIGDTVDESINGVVHRIKHGRDIERGDFTFVVKLERDRRHVCNGVLVDRRWVATLKSCIEKHYEPRHRSEHTNHAKHTEGKHIRLYFHLWSALRYRVLLKPDERGKVVKRSIKKFKIVYGKYEEILLLRLNKKVRRKEDKVRQFDRFSTRKIDKELTSCKAVGFSQDGCLLTEVDVRIKPAEKCKNLNSKTSMCFKTIKGTLCQNDNGTPIVCKLEQKWYLMGLAVVEEGCGRKNIGIRMSHYSRAIENIINPK